MRYPFLKHILVAFIGVSLSLACFAQSPSYDNSSPGSFVPTQGVLSRACRVTVVSADRIDTVDLLKTPYIRTQKLPSGRTVFNFSEEGSRSQVKLAVDDPRVSEFTKLLLKCIQHEMKAPDILPQEWSSIPTYR